MKTDYYANGRKQYMKKYYEDNKEKLREYGKKWYRENARVEQEALLTASAGRPRAEFCEVCGDVSQNKGHGFPTLFDHDHKTGKFRGWICNGCNCALGWIKDNPDTLRKLADYLDKFNEQSSKEPSKVEIDRVLSGIK